MYRRIWILGLAGAAAWMASRSAFAQPQPTAEPIRVFLAKRIITMDPGWPSGTAVAVKQGRVLSVGSLQDLQPWLDTGPHEIVRTLEDKILMPGFIEPHGHPLIGGMALGRPLLAYQPALDPYGPPFPGVQSKEQAIDKLREQAAQQRPGATLLAWGYDAVALGGHLTKDDLDRVSREMPIVVWDVSQQFVYLNTAAMRKHKINRQTARPPGALFAADGGLSGQFVGAAGAQPILLAELSSLLTPDAAGKALKRMTDLSRQGGITTTSDLAFGAVNLESEETLYSAYFNDPKTPLRCVAVAHGPTLRARFDRKAVEYATGLGARSTDKLIHRGVKLSLDDSFVSHRMAIESPGYTDGRVGVWHIAPGKELLDQLRPWWRADIPIHLDCNGNAAIHAALEALDALQKDRPRLDHRFTLEHYGVSTPEHARRAKQLGAIASVNPYYLHYYAHAAAPAIGVDRAFTAARLRTLLDAGVPTTLHSNPPLGPPRPLEWAWIAVNRVARSGGVLAPAEKVSVHQAMRMITVEAAHALGIDEHAGSIQAGKLADFAILEDNPYEAAPERLNAVRVWGTIVGGVIYPASEIRP